MVREFSIICFLVREKSGKTNYLVSLSFSVTIGMVVRKVIALSVVSKCEICALHYEITSIICITYLLGSIFLTSFVNM